MSWPVTAYYCTKCDFRQTDVGTWGTTEYILSNGVRIPLHWVLGWCADCKGIVAVESLDMSRREAELLKAECELAKRGPLRVRRWWQIHRFLLPVRWRRDLVHSTYFAAKLEDARAVLRLIIDRQTPPKCLTCGGNDIISPLFADACKRDDRWQPSRTGFSHPGCGGDIWMSEDGMRIGLKPSIRRYAPEGMPIGQEYVPGYTNPSSVYFDDRDAENAQIRGIGIDGRRFDSGFGI